MDSLPAPTTAGTVVLVEGVSDRVAVTTLARVRGLDLAAAAVEVVAMGGATNISRFLRHYDPKASGVRVSGLCDLAELGHFRRALERSGLGLHPSRESLERVGFFACARDLEDELIRCLGTDAVRQVIEEQGEQAAFLTFQQQPYQRGRPVEQQLRRFLGTHRGRKAQYAQALVEALGAGAAPPPLERLLASL